MDKRTFIKTTSLAAGAAITSRWFSGCKFPDQPIAQKEQLTNWAGNINYTSTNVFHPTSVEEVQSIVKRCEKLKALGSKHAFNRIADSSYNLISMREMNHLIGIDKSSSTVTVEAGMKYGELAPILQENQFALANLASLPHITVAGACSTATHGSGMKNGNLSTAVSAIEFVDASGNLVNLSRKNNEDIFDGVVVNLGALGVLTSLTLDLVPAFNMEQTVYRNLPMRELANHFNDIQKEGYSVSLFTDWKNQNINEVWIKKMSNDGTSPKPDLFGAKAADKNLHPVEVQSAENVTDQLGIPGPWYERLPHFKMGFKPSTGKELQSEFFIPIEHAYDAIMAIESIQEKISPHLYISEIRTIAADSLWMSPCYKQTCVALHTTWKQEIETVMGLLPLFEEKLAPFNPRPHWAKLFTLSPSVLQSRYEKLKDFKELAARYDPKGKFRNEFLTHNLYS
ncbi:MAG: FAD-binding protein [Bacteroidetes bacterium]|nr:MAG: FAD-binding protein [Bacteroidota bacterium]